MSERPGQIAVAVAVLAAGVALAAGTFSLPDVGGYAKVGTRLFPGLIAAGLIGIGILLMKEALLTGFQNLAAPPGKAFNWPALAWLNGGVLAHMLFISRAGFIFSSVLLFLAVARAFGSRRLGRDLVIAVALAVLLFLVFTQALTLTLPWGSWMPGDL